MRLQEPVFKQIYILGTRKRICHWLFASIRYGFLIPTLSRPRPFQIIPDYSVWVSPKGMWLKKQFINKFQRFSCGIDVEEYTIISFLTLEELKGGRLLRLFLLKEEALGADEDDKFIGGGPRRIVVNLKSCLYCFRRVAVPWYLCAPSLRHLFISVHATVFFLSNIYHVSFSMFQFCRPPASPSRSNKGEKKVIKNVNFKTSKFLKGVYSNT